MADKLLKYDVAMKSTKTVWQMETPICYTGDENTVTFDFNIIDLEEADLVGVIPNVYLYMRDGSFFQNGPADGVEITGTTVNYTMKGNEGKHSGIAKAQLVLVWDDEVNPPEKLTSQMYAFEVVSGLENKVAVEVMIQDWTTLTREARTFIDTSADEVDALKGELQTAITTANTSLGEFDVALQNGIVATNIAAELKNLEEAYAPNMVSLTQQFAETDARISNIVATAGDGTIPSELSDIRVGKSGDIYLSAGDFTRAASEGRVPKSALNEVYAHKYGTATHNIILTPRTYNGRTLGISAAVTIVESNLYWYMRARLAGKVFNDIKAKKFRVTVRSDKDANIRIRTMNGTAWGSEDGKLGSPESFDATLNATNKREVSVIFDFSKASYATFYAVAGRELSPYQDVYFSVAMNEGGLSNPAGIYNLSYEVSEVVYDKFDDLTASRHITSAAYAESAGTAFQATNATNATVAASATSAGTAAKSTLADRAISADLATYAGLGNFFATARLAWEGIGASILALESGNTLRIKYEVGLATGSIYYVRIPLCPKVSDLVGRTIYLNGKNLNAGNPTDIGDAGYTAGFSCINSGQWGNVVTYRNFIGTLVGDVYSGDALRTILLAAGFTDNSPVYVQLSNNLAYYAQTAYSCDKSVQVLLSAKAGEANVIANSLIGFTPSDYAKKSDINLATPLAVNTFAGSSGSFNTFTKTMTGLITRITRPEIPNPSSLWSYGLVSVNLGPLSGLANKLIHVHFDDALSTIKFTHFPRLTKSYGSWSTRMDLPNNDSSEFYRLYEPKDLYEKIVANGQWAPTDNVYLCFTYDLAAGSSGTVVQATDVSISVLMQTISDYTTKTGLQIADKLDGFDPSDYALATELQAAVESALASDSYITCWGDSLTAGGGWTTQLQTLSGKTVYNGGTGGENVKTIVARQGADVMMINNITIPATTDAVLIASRNVDGGIKTAFGHTVTPLLQGGAHVNPVMIDGIEGTLSWTGADYADMNGTWTFRRTTAGTEKVINRPTAIRTEFDRNKNAGIQIIFIGQNGGYVDDADLVNTHDLMMAHSTAKHTIILGLSSGSATSRAAYETAMRKEFGRYFVSLREYLSTYGIADAGLTPTQADLDAMATGTVPPQLLSDTVHYTSATKTVIGNMLYKKMIELNIL